MDYEVKIETEAKNYFFSIDINHVPIKEIALLSYKFYHKKWWCYNKAFKRYKRKSLSLTVLSAGSIISGAAAGGLTLNPVILGVLISVEIIVKVLLNSRIVTKIVNQQDMLQQHARTFWMN